MKSFLIAFGAFVLGSTLYAADPCRDCPVEVVVDDVSGGLSTTLPDYKIAPQFSPYMRNVIIDEGKIELPGGFVEIGSTNTLGAPTGIYPHVQEDGTIKYVVTDSSVALYTSDFNFYTFISSGHNTNVILRCRQIRNNMWCMNGIDSTFSWDGSAKTVLDGTNGTPNVPKAKFAEYYQERVFLWNLSGEGSQSRYSDFRSTNAVQISPENFLAWPPGNVLNVDDGDGEVGSAIWVENSQLQFGKEKSIHTLFGTNRGNYTDRETSPDVGVASHDSVVLIDGEAHFLGKDGFYVGRTRISDHISKEVDSINKDTQKILENLWETKEDFDRGEFRGTTTTVLGIVTLPQKEVTLNLDTDALFLDFAIPGGTPMEVGTTFYGPVRLDFRGSWGDQSLYLKDVNPLLSRSGNPATDPIVRSFVKNFYTGESHSTTTAITGGGQTIFFSSQTIFEGWQVNTSSFIMHFEYLNPADTDGSEVTVAFSPTQDFKLQSATTGQFVSDIATNTSITAWGKFDSLRNLNEGSIDFYVKTGTDPFHVTNPTRTWTSQSAGTNIDKPLGERYVQWAATLTTVSSFTNIPEIDNVIIAHVEGSGASNRAFATKWMNRYWVFTTTETSDLSLGFIKSKNTSSNPIAWMPIEGIDIRSMASDGETLYAGSSSTGIFYRLDSGDNFNGKAIHAVYHTPSKFMGDIFTEKTLYEYYLVADRESGKEVTLGLSIDGNDFVDQTIDLDGTGQVVKTIRKVRKPNITGKLFKWRFDFNQLDKDLGIKNFGVLYKPSRVRSGINE